MAESMSDESMPDLPWGPSEQCTRCGTEEDVDEERFQYTLFDSTESTGSLVSGNLCSQCYADVTRFVNGDE